MRVTTVAEIAKKWDVSERTVRNYCAQGKIEGAFLTGRTWNVPIDAQRPERINKYTGLPRDLLEALKNEKESSLRGGIYHKVQIDFAYNSNHIEGSKLTHEQTRHIFETNTIGIEEQPINIDDLMEAINHFQCVDTIIDNVSRNPTEKFIKNLHYLLKRGTSDSRKDWFAVGDYKKLPNEVGGQATTPPVQVSEAIRNLLERYNSLSRKAFEDILDFHVCFERIHPFQDDNGRVGRLIMFKECLRHKIVPFIIDDEIKYFYYRGLAEWESERGYLIDTCLSAQDAFKQYLDYFEIPYKK